MKVKLPIFWHTDDTRRLEELGIETKSEDEYEAYDHREVIFYNITAICVYDKKYSKIFAQGAEFICALSINELEKRIDDANT